MTKEEVQKYLVKNEILLVRGPRGRVSTPWISGHARKPVMEHISEQVANLVNEKTKELSLALQIQENVLKSYKDENAELKEQIKELKSRGTPCERCGATGTVVKDGDDSHMCPDCMGLGML